ARLELHQGEPVEHAQLPSGLVVTPGPPAVAPGADHHRCRGNGCPPDRWVTTRGDARGTGRRAKGARASARVGFSAGRLPRPGRPPVSARPATGPRPASHWPTPCRPLARDPVGRLSRPG